MKKIAITLDDFPNTDQHYFSPKERISRILTHLESHQVGQAAFFTVTERFSDETTPLLNMIGDKGHVVGNHTHSHPNLIKSDGQTFLKDVQKADEILNQYSGFKRWFRYPYLNEGRNDEDTQLVRQGLAEMDYVNFHTTIPTLDFFMDKIFQERISHNDSVDLDKLRQLYVDLIMENVELYHKLSTTVLSVEMPHVLLLHETDLNALFLGDLLAALKELGWQIVNAEEIMEDPYFNYQPDTGPLIMGKITAMIKEKFNRVPMPDVLEKDHVLQRWKEVLD